jgi:hypothetical protein
MLSAFRSTIAKDGAGALLTGLGPTVVGYSIQGAFKFGGCTLLFPSFALLKGSIPDPSSILSVQTSSGRSRPSTTTVSRLPERTDRPSTSEPPPSLSSSPTSPSAPSRPSESDSSPSPPSPTVSPVDSLESRERRVSVVSTPVSVPFFSSRSLTPWPSSPSTRSPSRRSATCPARSPLSSPAPPRPSTTCLPVLWPVLPPLPSVCSLLTSFCFYPSSRSTADIPLPLAFSRSPNPPTLSSPA